MQLDRSMVNAFFEIKRQLPPEIQRKLRISSPNVGDNLVALYVSTEDPQVKELTRAFLSRAGAEWLEKLEPPKRLFSWL